MPVDDTTKKRIDEWIKKGGRNEYGDPKDTVYAGGNQRGMDRVLSPALFVQRVCLAFDSVQAGCQSLLDFLPGFVLRFIGAPARVFVWVRAQVDQRWHREFLRFAIQLEVHGKL